MIAPIVNTIPIVLKSDQRTKYYIIHHAIIADITYVTEFAKRGLIHASDFLTLMSHNFICKQAIRLKFSVLLVQ